MVRIHRLAPLLLLAAVPALAQVPPAWEAEADAGLLSLLVPEVKAMGAPEWVRPGVRLTFYGASATVRQSGYQLIEDPNGDWEDAKTGKKYRKTDDDPRPGDDAGASGDGYSQFDVVSVGRNAVALNGMLYTINRTDNTFLMAPLGGTIAHAACALDLWVHPAALAKLPLVNQEGFRVLKGKLPGADRPIDVVYIVSMAGGARSSWTYDLASGILLGSNTSTPSKPAPVHLPNQPPPSGPTQLTFTRFVS
ncbi:MAG: hypothetical protein MUE73_00690, partial [Planctomycetes bacterium]|nr:hypothetical protein [Planctomycetota bacterium]